jgi:hypothetical protein
MVSLFFFWVRRVNFAAMKLLNIDQNTDHFLACTRHKRYKKDATYV